VFRFVNAVLSPALNAFTAESNPLIPPSTEAMTLVIVGRSRSTRVGGDLLTSEGTSSWAKVAEASESNETPVVNFMIMAESRRPVLRLRFQSRR
jgi:hypothetical protein